MVISAGKSSHRVVVSINIVSPNRVPLFERVSQLPFVDLEVLFSRRTQGDRMWIASIGDKFRYQILPGASIHFGREVPYFYTINPTLVYHLLRSRLDVLVITSWDSFASQVGFLVAKLLRRPLVLWSGSTINEPSWARRLSLPVTKSIVRHADAYVAYGTRAKEYLVHLGAPDEKIFVATNTVDTEYFRQHGRLSPERRTQLKQKYRIRTQKTVLYVGQLIERKGVEYLIRAYARLREARADVGLAIAGRGYQEDRLKKLCSDEDIEDVFFLGYIDIERLPPIYGMADVFVLPSTQEVWGLVINEAMACGLPIITTEKVGASADLVEEGVNGYVVEAGSVDQLHAALKTLIDEPALCRKVGWESRSLIQRFGLDAAVKGFGAAIQYVTSGQSLRS